MALGENNGGPNFSVDEWGDMARVASMLEDLVDEGLTIEAMVRLEAPSDRGPGGSAGPNFH